jgi:UPF0716 family protein affecting phage T7 exclusion
MIMIEKVIVIIAGLGAIIVGSFIAIRSWRRIVNLEDAHLPHPHGEQGITWSSRDLWHASICIIAGILLLIVGLLLKG